MDLPIFIIHYTQLKERKIHIDNQLNKYNLNFTYITDYDKEVPHTVNELNLPLLRLNLSRNDVAHFYDIYEKYKYIYNLHFSFEFGCRTEPSD